MSNIIKIDFTNSTGIIHSVHSMDLDLIIKNA